MGRKATCATKTAKTARMENLIAFLRVDQGLNALAKLIQPHPGLRLGRVQAALEIPANHRGDLAKVNVEGSSPFARSNRSPGFFFYGIVVLVEGGFA